jgi:hypothetical protein
MLSDTPAALSAEPIETTAEAAPPIAQWGEMALTVISPWPRCYLYLFSPWSPAWSDLILIRLHRHRL